MTKYYYMTEAEIERRHRSEVRWAFAGGAVMMAVIMMVAMSVMGLL